MIKNDISQISYFFKQSAKTPSFLSFIDRARVNIDSDCGAKVIAVESVWSSDDKFLTKLIEKDSQND